MISRKTIRLGHTPDLDDAFMFYAIAQGKIPLHGIKFEHVIEDIQRLNKRAEAAELEVTAVSAAAFPLISNDYWILSVGSSVGQKYGPLVVSMHPKDPEDLKGQRIAVPGLNTTAYLLLRLAIPEVIPVEMPFSDIPEAIANEQVAAGVLIHEKQITYRDQGLLPILDLGSWWHKETGLPIALGLNVVKQGLKEETASLIARCLRDSIIFAMSHQKDAISWAMRYGRGIDIFRARQFVSMYVNEETIELSEKGEQSLHELYGLALKKGLISSVPQIKIIRPSNT
jgi:1,4-dihydroxy-6-naphthoate synthase